MNFSELFSITYYLDLTPQSSMMVYISGLYFLGLAVLNTHLRMVISKHEFRKEARKIIRPHLKNIRVLIILGLISVGLRVFEVPFLSMRIFTYILILWTFFEVYGVRKSFTHKISAAAKARQVKKAVDKYKPVQKKKKKAKRKK